MAIRFGLRRGWTRGLVDGSSPWLVLGGLAVIGWLADHHLHREAEVVFSEKLRPGESFQIIHEARP